MYLKRVSTYYFCTLTLKQLECDLALHGEQIRVLSSQADKMIAEKHFESDAIRVKSEEVTKRQDELYLLNMLLFFDVTNLWLLGIPSCWNHL